VVFARVDAATEGAARTQIEAALSGGALGIEISGAGGLHPLHRELPADSLARLIETMPPATPLRIDGAPSALAHMQRRHLSMRDPVAARAVGVDAAPETESAIADGRPWHAGGASDEQELGVVLATFVHHLRNGAARVGVALVADADQFRTIAKLRAMRLLLARIAEVSGIEMDTSIHAETAWRSMSARDPHVNILRATSAAFGAAVGGADSIAVLPFDALAGGDGQGRRLALNTQLILGEESYLARVVDPAAGSGAIEAATESLARVAWTRFQSIEAEGGIVAAIERRDLLHEIAETREARIAQAAANVVKMVGVNAYAGGAVAAANVRVEEKDRLVYRRVAEAFE
jgi:methylmalonyl-CoA mutase